jgi:very-short-patch-repair endonuclease
LAAVRAAGASAVASHFSAAALHGLIDPEPDRYPEVTVLGRCAPRHPGIRAHRTSSLDRIDRITVTGVPATSVARTLLDLAAHVSEDGLRSLVRRAQGQRLVNTEQLGRALLRLGPRRGSRKLATVIATGPAPTASLLEDVVLDLMLRGGLEHPDVNRPLIVGGRRVIPDFRWARQRLIVEADGAAWHETAISREADSERQALLEASGERVVRITWGQAVTEPARTLTRLRAAGAPLAESAVSRRDDD